MHWQSDTESLPAGELEFSGHAVQVLSLVCAVDAEYLPAAQAVHAAEPESVLYVPAAQAVHDEPKYPALHWQSDAESLPGPDMEFDGHVVQVVALVCPVKAENLPAAQAVHAAEPAIGL